MRDFKKLLIWQKAMEVVTEIYRAVEQFPAEERYGLRSQVTRSAVSIAANIAEGSAKSSQKEYRYFIEIALGSSYELETHKLIVEKMNWVGGQQLSRILNLSMEEQRMLSSFLDKLKVKA
jgi:four helix bundle protein